MILRTRLADRRLALVVGVLAALILVVLAVLAAMPWGLFKPTIEAKLSDRFGRPVTIGTVERLDSFSLTPRIEIRALRVPQADWAGPGDLARIDRLTLRLPVFPLLIGHVRPSDVVLEGARIALVRRADRRENWRKAGDEHKTGSGGGGPSLGGLRIDNAVVSYRDAVQQRAFTARINANRENGLTLNGTGTIRGEPVRITARAPAIQRSADKPWPFRATIDGAALRFEANGTMDAPLAMDRMTVDVTARADDLKFIDAVIEAGLFGTMPVRLKAHARHEGDAWRVTGINGTVGNSDITGHIDVRKQDGRTQLDGAVVSNRLNFDDFASRAGQAEARAKRQRIGPRLIPDTRINLAKIDRTDGRIAFTIRQLVSAKPSALRAMRGTMTIDHQLLTVAPFAIDMTRGAITGTVRVDQRNGGPVPLASFDLSLRNSSIAALAGGGGEVTGRVDGRVRLKGRGSTIREAVGASDGTIGLAARSGTLPAKIASFLGFDLARGLTTDEDARTGLRCAVLKLAMRGGTGTLDPFVIDTERSQANGHGTIRFPSESLAITLEGAPKQKSILRFPGALTISGSVKAPDVHIPPGGKSVGKVLKAIGDSITGHQAPKATDADCGALVAQALR